MSFLQKNENFRMKFLTLLFLVVCYWFYRSICFGYFLSKLFFNFFDEINKTNIYKSIRLRKKLHLKNLIRIISDFLWKFINELTICKNALINVNVFKNCCSKCTIFKTTVIKSS